jgi:hypothetical protein
MDNVDYVLNTTSGSTNTVHLYSHVIVQVEYTDAEGKTGLANIKMDGFVTSCSGGKKSASFDELGYPTVEDYDTWEGGKKFVSWVE